MGSRGYEVIEHAAAPPERVYDLLADATAWPTWAGPLVAEGSWSRIGEPPPAGVGAIRRVGRRPIYGFEEILVADRPHHHAYRLVGGPNPARGYRADVRLEPEGDGTRIIWRGEFDPIVPGTGALLARAYRGFIAGLARRLADHATRSSV
ncbi:MAG: SRPBCC family protein [Actinomycetota bacterium]